MVTVNNKCYQMGLFDNLPEETPPQANFRFIDLFAGIGSPHCLQ